MSIYVSREINTLGIYKPKGLQKVMKRRDLARMFLQSNNMISPGYNLEYYVEPLPHPRRRPGAEIRMHTRKELTIRFIYIVPFCDHETCQDAIGYIV